MKKLLLSVLALILLSSTPVHAHEKIRMVTTTTTLASITQDIAGDLADIYAIAPPKQDIHFITPNPRDVLKTKKADVFIHNGLDLEIWRPSLMNAAGRGDFMTGERAIDVSQGIEMLEPPASRSRLLGDIHAFGNPHFWSDPLNAKIMADNIAQGLARLYPQQAAVFHANAENFKKRIDQHLKEWQQRLAPFKNTPVIVYHNSWPYFLKRFEFQTAGFLEPKPGIPPTPKHIQELMQRMQEQKIPVIIKEVFHENRTPKKVAEKTGAQIVTLAAETGEIQGNYVDLIEHNVTQLENALKKQNKSDSHKIFVTVTL